MIILQYNYNKLNKGSFFFDYMIIDGKKVLITGITGFIGSELVHRLLEEGYEVYGFIQHVIGRDYSMIEDIKDKINIIT